MLYIFSRDPRQKEGRSPAFFWGGCAKKRAKKRLRGQLDHPLNRFRQSKSSSVGLLSCACEESSLTSAALPSQFPNDRLSPTDSSLSAHSDGYPRSHTAGFHGVLIPIPLFTYAPDGAAAPPLRPRGLCELAVFHFNVGRCPRRYYTGRRSECQQNFRTFVSKKHRLPQIVLPCIMRRVWSLETRFNSP